MLIFLNFQYVIKFPLGVIMENTEKEEIYKCVCGECCKQYDKHAIQISLAQGSALCACGACQIRVNFDNGKFTHQHTKRILWSTSKLGIDTNTFRDRFDYHNCGGFELVLGRCRSSAEISIRINFSVRKYTHTDMKKSNMINVALFPVFHYLMFSYLHHSVMNFGATYEYRYAICTVTYGP